jgi:putative ATP-dependent endonuclease of the OLD family
MYISSVVIKNYRCLRDSTNALNIHLNIIVGNNECGKSTFLEAVHLAISGQLNGRPIQSELHPHLFNTDAVADYIKALSDKVATTPPSILIELYLADELALSKLKGKNNSKKQDVPGIKMLIEFNTDYNNEYASYVADPKLGNYHLDSAIFLMYGSYQYDRSRS